MTRARETLAAFVDADSADDVGDLVERLDMQGGERFWRDYLERTLELMDIGAGSRTLDIGCGAGSAVRRMAAMVAPGGAAMGIDRSRKMVELSRERAAGCPDADFRQASAEDLPFADGSFDAARADRVFMYLASSPPAIAEATRVLRPGGRLVVSEPDMEGTWLDCGDVRLARKITEATARAVPNSGAARGLRTAFHDAGLEDVRIELRPLLQTSFAQMDKISSYQAMTDRAVATGDMSEEDVARWFADMLGREERGLALGGAVFFIVSGRKPR